MSSPTSLGIQAKKPSKTELEEKGLPEAMPSKVITVLIPVYQKLHNPHPDYIIIPSLPSHVSLASWVYIQRKALLSTNFFQKTFSFFSICGTLGI